MSSEAPHGVSSHQRLMEAVERAARAQEQSHALIQLHAALDARVGATLADLVARRGRIRSAREARRRSQSDK